MLYKCPLNLERKKQAANVRFFFIGTSISLLKHR